MHGWTFLILLILLVAALGLAEWWMEIETNVRLEPRDSLLSHSPCFLLAVFDTVSATSTHLYTS